MSEVLVIGLGSPDRGDDAAGYVLASRFAAMDLPGVRVVTREDPTQLVQLWDGVDGALVFDAVMSGRPAGTIHVREVGAAGGALPTHAFTAAGRGGSHAFGLAGAVELSRELGTLPRLVTVIGIEAATFDYGNLSPDVQEAIEPAFITARAELTELRVGVM